MDEKKGLFINDISLYFLTVIQRQRCYYKVNKRDESAYSIVAIEKGVVALPEVTSVEVEVEVLIPENIRPAGLVKYISGIVHAHQSK